MAKQTTAARKAGSAAKTARTAKQAASRKPVARKSAAPAAKKAAGKVVRTKVAPKKVAPPRPKAAPVAVAPTRSKKVAKPVVLGRPRVPGDAQLDLVFHKDFKAREVFEFLGVRTIRELEKYDPDEIVHRLTGPMIQTVGRIRKVLAIANRCLKGDEKFALEFRDDHRIGE